MIFWILVRISRLWSGLVYNLVEGTKQHMGLVIDVSQKRLGSGKEMPVDMRGHSHF